MKRFLMMVMAAAGLAGSAMAQETPVLTQSQQPAIAEDLPAPALQGPMILLQTTMGDITVQLDTVGAPKTAAQFLALVKAKHYDGAAFYRVEPGFVIQLGDLDANQKYRPAKRPPVPLETANNKHSLGALAMAHGEDPNSGQSTFYIDLDENSGLNATEGAAPNTTGYAVFGKVISGMEVVTAIAAVERAPTGGPFPGMLPKVPVVVKKASVVRTF